MDEANINPEYPVSKVTKAEKERLRRPWWRSLIIHVLGQSVGYSYLLRRLQVLWKPEEQMELIALAHDYFLVKFDSQRDLDFARFEGPWIIMGHYLVVQEWTPNFDPTENKTEKLTVWLWLPAIPIEYFDEDFLKKIGKQIGRPIKIDDTTSLVSKGKFARVCVEIDVTKPLVAKFNFLQKLWPIKYDGIHLVCFKCGLYGHRREQCGVTASPEANSKPRHEPENGDAGGKDNTTTSTAPLRVKTPMVNPHVT
ncbi:uncharacterized protein LOC116026910 [Ipomoea triloba]|uniref:uncharacterized protein LOC116026910 n=1 Tax=Ipomoea triloba TaxID=35885 RepID=UPI00125D3739|nr:uncharacterized protein LOC116026910 [Ipomoea triloba]